MHGNQLLSNNKQYQTQEPLVTLSAHQDNTRKIESSIKRQYRGAPTISENCFTDVRGQHAQEIQIYLYEIETLKEHLESQEQENVKLQEIIMQLKRQISTISKENNKLFQQNQKNRQLVQKLKIDNKSMEMQIDKFRGERKTYYNKMNDIDGLKRQIEQKMMEKNMSIDQLMQKIRKMERGSLQNSMKAEQFQRGLKQAQEEKKQLRIQVKQTLEKYLACSNLSNKMEYQLREVNEINKSMKDKIYELQKQRQEYRQRLGFQDENSLSASNKSTYPQRSMLEIQSYMKEIENVVDLKAQQIDRKRKNYEKIKLSVECLQKHL